MYVETIRKFHKSYMPRDLSLILAMYSVNLVHNYIHFLFTVIVLYLLELVNVNLILLATLFAHPIVTINRYYCYTDFIWNNAVASA